MSKSVSALAGVSYDGFAQVSEAGQQGMITVRGDLGSAAMRRAVKRVTGTALPAPRRIVAATNKAAAWMSPDELLVLVPYPEANATVEALVQALAGEHVLIADVSDARTLFHIRGAKAAEVLMKLCPVDFETLASAEFRRTRAAQVGAALWKSAEDEFSLITFRSVAGYVMALLETSARKGSELFPETARQ